MLLDVTCFDDCGVSWCHVSLEHTILPPEMHGANACSTIDHRQIDLISLIQLANYQRATKK